MTSQIPKKAKKPSGSCGSVHATLCTYEDVVRDCISERRHLVDSERTWWAARPDFPTALKLAATCRTHDDKRHPHQRRLPGSSLKAVHAKLATSNLKATSFDDLHRRIDLAVGNKKIPMVGELAVYDIALRLAYFLNLEPERVYLHRGTRIGARNLGLGHGQATIEVRELPKAFQDLSACEIEDCLCVYQEQLLRIYTRLQAQ